MSFLNPILFAYGKADIEDPPLEEYPISIVIKRFFLLCSPYLAGRSFIYPIFSIKQPPWLNENAYRTKLTY